MYNDTQISEMVTGYILEQHIPYVREHITAYNMIYKGTFKKYKCIIDFFLVFDEKGTLKDDFTFIINKIGRDPKNEIPKSSCDNHKIFF